MATQSKAKPKKAEKAKIKDLRARKEQADKVKGGFAGAPEL